MVRKILVLLLLVMLPGVAHAQWHEASSDHFVIYSKDRPERLQKFAETLERFDLAMRGLRGWKNDPVAPAARLTIFVLGSTDAVGELAGDSMVAGFYSGRASGSVAFVPRVSGTDTFDLNAQTILFHEYTHHLMMSEFANAAFPAWLVEGWAEFHATAQIQRDGSVTFGYAPNYRAWGLLSGNPLPLERILGGNLGKMTDQQTDSLYGRSWLLTHYFTFEPSRSGQLGKYIRAINAGKPASEAMTEFGDLRVLNRELDRYLKKPSLSGRTVPASAIKLGPIRIRPLTEGEAATMPVRIRSDRGVDEKTAPRVYAAAKKAAAPYPNDPAAQGVLAETAYDAQDYEGALAAAERALAVDPASMQALIYKALTQMAIAEKNKDYKRETWSAIRKTLVAANKVDPDNPEVLILYYRSFVDAGQTAPAVARDGLYRAYELVPQDRGLRFQVAAMFLDDGKPEVARALLVPMLQDPHSGELAAQAAKVIAEIDAGDTKAAQKDVAAGAGSTQNPPPKAGTAPDK
jgi:tetratricopeptide (TPR) repeat protein